MGFASQSPGSNLAGFRRSRYFWFVVGAVVLVLFIVPLFQYHDRIPTTLGQNAEQEYLDEPTVYSEAPSTSDEPKYAYATFMFGAADPAQPDDEDGYFVHARMLAYQLLHDPATKTRLRIPFVVVCTPDLRQSKRDRLEKDGATVIEFPKITSDWIATKTPKWREVLSKLHIFELEQFDKVAFFDTDTLILKPMDGIFDDAAAMVASNLGDAAKAPEDEGPQPQQYLFAGNAGAGGFDHAWPPPKNRQNLNAGCLVFGPSKALFQHYLQVASIPNRFVAKYPEQSLWSYVHRRDGNMPWKQLHYGWNTNWASFNDSKRAASLHTKFWENEHDPKLKELLMRSRWKMEGYWERFEES